MEQWNQGLEEIANAWKGSVVVGTPHTEYTFKDSKWTVFHTGYAGGAGLSPFTYIAIQAPTGVAVDIMSKHGLNPFYQHCEHCGDDFVVHEQVEEPWVMLSWNSHASMMCYRYDTVPYLDAKLWRI